MSECFRELYIENGELKNCNTFNDALLNEGKSIYEVIRIIKGVPLFLEKHLVRFNNSAHLINEALFMNDTEFKEQIVKLTEANGIYEGNVKIVFNYSNNGCRALFYFVKHSYPLKEQYDQGVDTILFHGERSNPNAKVINKNFKEAVEKEIRDKAVYEAVLVDNNGYITEGSKSNIFMVRGNTVITSPLEAVLPGVTRGVILELLGQLNVKTLEEKVSYKDLDSLDALFITGTSPKVLPIRKLEAVHYNSSANNIVKSIMGAYDQKLEEYIIGFKND